jgi:multiple sugar transport system permease protein
MRRRWWIKAPWYLYFAVGITEGSDQHLVPLMLMGNWDWSTVVSELFGIEGPLWFNDRWRARSNTISYIWKWMPFWTLIFLAGRMAIPKDIYDAAEVDGATGARRFIHVTFPLLANLYLICTLLSTIWTLGDFVTPFLVSGPGPAHSTEVLATLGFRYAYDAAKPPLGVAAMVSALPVLIPIVIILMRKLQTREVQL